MPANDPQFSSEEEYGLEVFSGLDFLLFGEEELAVFNGRFSCQYTSVGRDALMS